MDFGYTRAHVIYHVIGVRLHDRKMHDHIWFLNTAKRKEEIQDSWERKARAVIRSDLLLRGASSDQ